MNTIVPSKLDTKLRALGLDTTLCNLIQDCLTGRQQAVRIGNNTSTLTLNTGAPQECFLSPLLYSLFTHACMALHNIKFADDTTVVGLITNNDESAYREEVGELALLFQDYNLSFNISITKVLIVDFRKQRSEHAPIHINGTAVENQQL